MAHRDQDEAWKVPGLTPTQRLVLLALANHRNGNKDDDRYDQCNPGYTLLAKETGLSPGAVSGAITKLEKRNASGETNEREGRKVLRVVRDPKCSESNRYYFCWNKEQGSSDEPIRSPNEPPVHVVNPTHSPDEPTPSPGEHPVHQVNQTSKEAVSESVKLEAAKKQQQQPPPGGGAVAAAVTPCEPIKTQEQDGASARDEVSALAEQFYLWMGKAKKADVSKGIRKFPALLSKHPGLSSHLRFVFENHCASKLKDNLLGSDFPFSYLDSGFLEGVQDRLAQYESKMEKHRQDVARKAAAAAASGTHGTAIRNLEDEEGSSAEENLSADRTSLEEEGW
jgi:hypothetical protein